MRRATLFAFPLVATAAVASPQNIPANTSQSNCRMIGGAQYCDPPPAQPLSPQQWAALNQTVIAEEREILAPLAGGVNASACSAVIQNATAERRPDLAAFARKHCEGQAR